MSDSTMEVGAHFYGLCSGFTEIIAKPRCYLGDYRLTHQINALYRVQHDVSSRED